MSNHGSRFDREFTPDDLAIVNMGYWDPNADEDSEQADLAPIEASAETEFSKPAETDAEPAEHEVVAAPLDEMTEEAEEAEAAETVEDSDGSDISNSSEESQETASRESKESVTKSAAIPVGGPPPHPVWRSMPKPNSPRSRQSPAASKAPSKRSLPLPKCP